MSMYRLAINSRADANGKIWFMVEDGKGEQHAPRLAQYLEHNRIAPPRSIVMESYPCFAGVPADVGVTAIVRACSEFFTGDAYGARFDRCEDAHVNAGNGPHASVQPTLYFRIIVPAREEI